MSGFWNVAGETITAQETIEVAGGGNNDMPIPAGTQVKGIIDDVQWKTNESEGTFINIKWKIQAPECYEGRVIFQKIHVRCHEFKSASKWREFDEQKMNQKRAQFLRMLATIDTNAGGKLLSSQDAPTDERLQTCLVGKAMALVLEVWESKFRDGVAIQNAVDYGRGNWVKAVAPKGEFKNMSKDDQAAAVARTDEQYRRMLEAAGGQKQDRPQGGGGQGGGMPQQRQQQGGGQSAMTESFDDDIPF